MPDRWTVTARQSAATVTVEAERAWQAWERAELVVDGVRLAFGQCRVELADAPPKSPARRGSADDPPLVVSPPVPISPIELRREANEPRARVKRNGHPHPGANGKASR